jgi:surface polysaccharide O-acyltransferase-like enzyme
VSERLHHLDALRALTMLLILPAHALALVGLSNGGWNGVERTAYWLIHVFRLPLFFLVAGFFGALLLDARGIRSLLGNRLVRIGIPMLAVVLLVAPPLDMLVQSQMGISLRPQGIGALLDFHPSYVWFLWYLAIIYATTLLARWALERLPATRNLLLRSGSGLLSHPAAPLLLAIPCALSLYWQPTWVAEAPSVSFLPRPDLLAYYGVFFAAGWVLFAAEGVREKIELRPRSYLFLAALALPPALALYLLQGEPEIGTSRGFHLLALFLLSVSTWSLVFGLPGLARHFLPRPSPRLRYWADASYWIYLSHLPVMAVLALVIFELPLPDGLRIVLLVFVTLGLIFPAYGAVVRHSAIGRVLHGPRPPAKRSSRLRWGLAKPTVAGERRA